MEKIEMNVKSIRRENMRALAKSVGGIGKLALKLNKTQSQISHLIGKSPIKQIGDKIAAQVEVAFDKPSGWLDREQYRIEETQTIYRNDQGHSAILCRQVPLITWSEAKEWNQRAYDDPPKSNQLMTTTASVGELAFALQIQDESMQSSSGINFPVGAFIIADPDEVALCGSFVITTVNPNEAASLKQLVTDGNKRYLKTLNLCYPIVEYTIHTMIYGVVKQMMINFKS